MHGRTMHSYTDARTHERTMHSYTNARTHERTMHSYTNARTPIDFNCIRTDSNADDSNTDSNTDPYRLQRTPKLSLISLDCHSFL